MKITLMLALLLLFVAAPQLAKAQSTKGTYQITMDDGSTKDAQFDAQTQPDGSAVGALSFSDDATLTIRDLDGTGEPTQRYAGYTMSVDFDGLTVQDNQAVMSGTVRDSTVKDFIGQRVLLTVEDNGDNTRLPDKMTWGLYEPAGSWPVSDAELKEDPGVGLTWIATDAERTDDRGIEMPRSKTINSGAFPLSSYDFVNPERSSGDILVQP